MKYCNTADLNGIVPSIKDGGCATVEQIQDAVHNKVGGAGWCSCAARSGGNSRSSNISPRRAAPALLLHCGGGGAAPLPPCTTHGMLRGQLCAELHHCCRYLPQVVTITILNITSEDGNPRLVNEMWDSEALSVFACVRACCGLWRAAGC